jgi:hypothetical protein
VLAWLAFADVAHAEPENTIAAQVSNDIDGNAYFRIGYSF